MMLGTALAGHNGGLKGKAKLEERGVDGRWRVWRRVKNRVTGDTDYVSQAAVSYSVHLVLINAPPQGGSVIPGVVGSRDVITYSTPILSYPWGLHRSKRPDMFKGNHH